MDNYAIFSNADVPRLDYHLAQVPAFLKNYGVQSRADWLNRARATVWRPAHSEAFQLTTLVDRLAAAPAWYWEAFTGLPLEQPVAAPVTVSAAR